MAKNIKSFVLQVRTSEAVPQEAPGQQGSDLAATLDA
jgi:hypothetical protein